MRETLPERNVRLSMDEVNPISIWGDRRSGLVLRRSSQHMCYRISTESDVVEQNFVRTVVRKVTPEQLFKCNIENGMRYSTIRHRTVGRFRNELQLKNRYSEGSVEVHRNYIPNASYDEDRNEIEVVDVVSTKRRKRRHIPTGKIDRSTGNRRRKRQRRMVSIGNAKLFSDADREGNADVIETHGQLGESGRRRWNEEERNISEIDRDKFWSSLQQSNICTDYLTRAG